MCFLFQFLKQKGQEAKGLGMLPLPCNWKVEDFGSFINKERAEINLCLEPYNYLMHFAPPLFLFITIHSLSCLAVLCASLSLEHTNLWLSKLKQTTTATTATTRNPHHLKGSLPDLRSLLSKTWRSTSGAEAVFHSLSVLLRFQQVSDSRSRGVEWVFPELHVRVHSWAEEACTAFGSPGGV